MAIFYIIVIAAIILYVIYIYNNIIRNRNTVDKAFGSVDVMLKKRYDLIPNLIEIVKQYSTYENTLLSEITKTRSQLTDNISNNEKIELHNNLNKQISGMMLSVENYPNLKANQNYLNLQASWNEIEEQLSATRRYYNTAVTEYNNSIQTFPANLIVDNIKFEPKKVLVFNEEIQQNISARELFKNN